MTTSSWAPGGATVLLDTDPHPGFTCYAAGNFAEVAPDRISPMSWSLVGIPVEAGLRRIADRLLPRVRWASGSHFVFVGYFAAKPYHNLSALCHLATHVPRLDPHEVTRCYFEDAAPPELPKQPVPMWRRLAMLPRFVREIQWIRGETVRLDGRLAALERAVTSVVRGSAPLGPARELAEARAVLDRAWEVHYSATITLVPLVALHSAMGERLVPHWAELEPWLNRPGELVWATMADAVAAASPELAEFLPRFGYEVADDQPPWSSYRGAVWIPADGSSRREEEWQVPAEPWDVVPANPASPLPHISGLVRRSLEQRELTKSLAMRSMHLLRRLLPVIADQRGVAQEQWPYLGIGELAGAQTAAQLRDRAEERRAVCDLARTVPMPERLETGFARVSEELTGRGRGVSPGQAEGLVVFPGGDIGNDGPPRVLVCEAADVQVLALLPRVDGLVTARGSALSHVAIMAREQGLPAVLGHPLARELKEGQRVRVNGVSGEVSLVAEQP